MGPPLGPFLVLRTVASHRRQAHQLSKDETNICCTFSQREQEVCPMAGPARGNFTYQAFLSSTATLLLLASDFAESRHSEISGVMRRGGIINIYYNERLLIFGREVYDSYIQYSLQSMAPLEPEQESWCASG